jgi:hypothetical protein
LKVRHRGVTTIVSATVRKPYDGRHAVGVNEEGPRAGAQILPPDDALAVPFSGDTTRRQRPGENSTGTGLAQSRKESNESICL